jgi:two-component system cell cycle response regulator
MPDRRPEVLQDRRSRADAQGVRREPARPPTDPVGPVSIVLVALTAAALVAVALGAPDLILAIPAVCVVSMAAIALHTLRRTRRAEAALAERGHQVNALENRLVEEAEARQNAESRLAWRSRLGSLRRQRVGDTMLDPESGLLLEALLFTNVESRIAAGRRRLTPVAVIMFEVLEYVEIDDPRPIDAGTTAGLLQATLREADGSFRLDEGGFCVVLEDTDDTGAMNLARRFGQALEAMAPGAVVRAGVACYPAHGLTSQEVLDRADEALDEARRWRQHRIEIARADRTA